MGIRFSNNAKTNLAASITATDLILTVTPTTGAKFPVLIGTDDNYCVVTLEDAAGNREFVKVSRRTSDTLGDGTYPCVRGYWGSTPRVWASATTTVDIRWAADAVQDYLQNISGRYLGAYAADPTTDNFGAALKTGDLYYDTAGSVLKKYASGAWGSAYLVNAASTTFTPAGGLAATNVQAALQELDSEKANASALSSYQTVAGMSSYATVANPAFTGDMTLSGGANRIRGDFSNGTVASRAMFQTSNLNTPTHIGAIPNGTGGDSRWIALSASDPNNASFVELGVNTASAITFVGSGKSGTGTLLPLTFWTSGSRALDLQTDGNISFGFYNPVAGGNRNLYIANTDTTAGSAAQLQLANGAVGAVYYVGHIYGGALLGTYTNHDLVFQRNASEVARLTSLHKIKSLATAKAWVNFNGTTGAIYAAFNVSSVTRNAVGDYTANITAGVLADANFAWSSGGDGSISNGTSLENEVSRSSTSLRLQVVRASAVADPTRMSIIIFGN